MKREDDIKPSDSSDEDSLSGSVSGALLGLVLATLGGGASGSKALGGPEAMDAIRGMMLGRVSFDEDDQAKMDEAGYVDGNESVCEMNNTLMLFGPPARMVLSLLCHMALVHKVPSCLEAVVKMGHMYEWACDYAVGLEGILGHPIDKVSDSIPRLRADLAIVIDKATRILAGEEVSLDDLETTEREPDQD